VTRALGIDRITRYNLTSFATASASGRQFSSFDPIDDGRASNCRFPQNPNVGCGLPWYRRGRSLSHYWQEGYGESLFFSLPGRCPGKRWADKTAECMWSEPGGECASPDGSEHCTWRADPLGWVEMDELSGIVDRSAHCAAGRVDYDRRSDKGRGVCFWDGRNDARLGKERAARLNELFIKKYPLIPGDIPPPQCA